MANNLDQSSHTIFTPTDNRYPHTEGQFTHRRHDTTPHGTTRQHATQPVFWFPIQSNGSVHTYAARPSHDKKLPPQKSLWKRF